MTIVGISKDGFKKRVLKWAKQVDAVGKALYTEKSICRWFGPSRDHARIQKVSVRKRMEKEAEQMQRLRDVCTLLRVADILESPKGSIADVEKKIDVFFLTDEEERIAEEEGRKPKYVPCQLKTTKPQKSYPVPVIWWDYETQGMHLLLASVAQVLNQEIPMSAYLAVSAWQRFVFAAQMMEREQPEAKVRVGLAKLDGKEPTGKDLALLEDPWVLSIGEVKDHIRVWEALHLASQANQDVRLNKEEVKKYFS